MTKQGLLGTFVACALLLVGPAALACGGLFCAVAPPIPAPPEPVDQNAERMSDPKMVEAIIDATPLGRLGTPEDVLHAIVYLVSEDSSWMTGASISLDGGFTIT